MRLLIAEASENAAHQFDSLLRDAGIAARPEFIDLTMARDALTDADLMLCNGALPQLDRSCPSSSRTRPTCRSSWSATTQTELATADALRLGAADVVPVDESELLVLVVKRELEHVCQSNRLGQTERALKEAEQRCQLLLQSSKAAIAYVHEGMHIYANEGYFKLFGFEDADDLLGLPLIDLLESDSAETLKAELKQFRNAADHEAVFDFTGQSTSGEAVHGNMTLASAEYEGEACLQVTVRTAASAQPAPADAEPAARAARDAESPAPAAAPPSREQRHASLTTFVNATTALFASQEEWFRATFVAVVDTFRELQSEHGLVGAEQICHDVERTIRENLGDVPMARLGSHEFAVSVLCAERDDAWKKVDACRQAVETLLLEINEKTVRPTVTFGGAVFEQAANDTADACLNSAYATALEALEQADGNHVELPSEAADGEEVSDEATKVLSLINEAIEEQKFVLLFQPIISLRGDSDEHYEVFLRMLDRDGKQLPPSDFLRTAIDNGVAGKMTDGSSCSRSRCCPCTAPRGTTRGSRST